MGEKTPIKGMLTKDDIDVSEKNEWGYPLSSIWKSEGFIEGAGRYTKADHTPARKLELERREAAAATR